MVLIGLAVFGLLSEPRHHARTGRRPDQTIPRELPRRSVRADPISSARDRVLWLAVLGNIYFSFLGALVLQNVVIYGTDVLRDRRSAASVYLQVALAIGIGVGSFAAGYLSGGKIEYGLVPLGSIGMTVFGALLARPDSDVSPAWRSDLAVLGFFGGFFIVPITAIMQHRPDRKDERQRARRRPTCCRSSASSSPRACTGC